MTRVSNETTRMLCLFVEPWGADHWMRPGETFTVVTTEASVEQPFDVIFHDQGVSVMVNSAYSAEVIDQNGNVAPCGHQRPAADQQQLWVD